MPLEQYQCNNFKVHSLLKHLLLVRYNDFLFQLSDNGIVVLMTITSERYISSTKGFVPWHSYNNNFLLYVLRLFVRRACGVNNDNCTNVNNTLHKSSSVLWFPEKSYFTTDVRVVIHVGISTLVGKQKHHPV